MEHIYIEKDPNQPPLLLLHGTGGDEASLVELGHFISPRSSLLGIRGNLSEGGANRYFHRFAEGEFDLESLEKESDLLLAEIHRLALDYQLRVSDLVLVGYSNGANIGAHLMLERSDSLQKAILLHPMSLGKHTEDFSLANQQVWLSYGKQDPIVPAATFSHLVKTFKKREAKVVSYEANMSHGVTKSELLAAKSWLEGVT